MAEANQPKKETVRITLPPHRGDAVAPQDDDTERINLPAGPPTSESPPTSTPLVPKPGNVPIPRPPMSQVPLPKPPVATFPPPPPASVPPPPPPPARTPMPRPMGTAATGPASASAAAPAPVPSKPPTKQLAKETARISILPDPPKPAPMKMSKTQPLVTLTAASVTPPTAPVTIAPAAAPQRVMERIPTSLCWGLVLVSAAILIIEIWNYIS
jgi:neural Wiskott-Aldrich syndrome protein